MSNQREYRITQAKELRISNEDGKKTLQGYAAVFNSLSDDLGGWRETIVPGAFSRSLKSNPDVLALSEHDTKKGILGRTKSNTLSLLEDNIGLRFVCELPNTTLGNDIAESVSRGDLDGCSFGFIAQDTCWDKTDNGVVRSLLDVDLLDVTVTASPAYPATSVQMRSKMFPDGVVEVPDLEARTEPEEAQTQPDPTECACPCEACSTNADCEHCDNTCTPEMNCRCGDMVADRMLAALCERRLRLVA